MRSITLRALSCAFAAVAGLGAAASADAPTVLPAGIADPAAVSVSGLSSGGFMAAQFHVAFSESVMGAGIVAGGPYNCALGLLFNALKQCMATTLGEPDPAVLRDLAEDYAAQGWIDPLTGLDGDRVYLFAGQEDRTVAPAVVESARRFYELAGLSADDLAIETGIAAGHALITEDFGGACAATGSPFINDCDYDQAGVILAHIYGGLAPKSEAGGGRVRQFDQSLYLNDPERFGLAETGFLYLPADCSQTEPCRLHVAFHGCRQTTDDIGDLYVTHSGFNVWAETNRIAVLYPQASASPGNPNGCWDWWGYSGDDYALKGGKQMAAVKAMVDRLTGKGDRYCQRYADANYDHWLAGRAVVCDLWFFCARGSRDRLGLAYATSTLYEQPRGTFSLTACE